MNQLTPVKAGEIIEAVIARGDLAQLSPDERAKYYVRTCESVGLNPMTRPFEYITLNGKLTLYARKDCTDQLRTIHNISVTDLTETEREGVFIVTAKVANAKGRTDAAKGAVSIQGLKGEALANALMKAETKSKRRATLSICGLGFLDETEVEDIPAEAKGPRTTLPKKDAKDIYVRLQKEIDGATDRAAFKQWMLDNAERIGTMPEDWQDVLRLRAQEKIVDLQNLEGKAGATTTEVIDQETGEVTEQVVRTEDSERPATAADKPGQAALEKTITQTDAAAPKVTLNEKPIGTVRDPQDIPDNLKRLTPNQEGAWLALIKKVCGEAPDTQALMDQQATNMNAAQQRKVSSAGWVEAVRIFRERMQHLIDHPVFDAEVWLKGDLSGALSGAETLEQLTKVKDKVLIPEKEKLTPEQWKRAVKAYRDRLDEVDPQNALAGG